MDRATQAEVDEAEAQPAKVKEENIRKSAKYNTSQNKEEALLPACHY